MGSMRGDFYKRMTDPNRDNRICTCDHHGYFHDEEGCAMADYIGCECKCFKEATFKEEWILNWHRRNAPVRRSGVWYGEYDSLETT